MRKNRSIKKVFCLRLEGRQKFLRLLGCSAETSGLRAGLVTLKPKELIGEHKTENKEEVLVILKGSAIVHFGRNKKLQVSKNSFIFIPAETLHNVENSGKGILRYVYVTTQVVC